MKMSKHLTFLICALLPFHLFGQTTYNLQELISIALQHNYSIAIAKNDEQSASNLATRAQAGFLPSFIASSSLTASSSNTNLEFAGGLPPVEVKNAVNLGVNANLGLNYTLFSGFGKVYTFQSLKNAEKLSHIQVQMMSENLILEVVNAYLDAQMARISLIIAEQNFLLSKEVFSRLKKNKALGIGTSIDLMSAEFNKNQDSLSILQMESNLQRAQIALKVLCGDKLTENWTLSDELPAPQNIDFNEIENNAMTKETSILLAIVSKELAMSQSKLAESRRMPQVDFQFGYNYLNQQNGAGIILSQQVVGPSGNLTFSLPIFNGRQLSTAIKNAQLDVQSRAQEEELAKLRIATDLDLAKIDWNLFQQSLQLQYENVRLSEANYERAEKAYQRGLINYTELRTIQLQIQRAKSLVSEANIQILKLTYSLMRISGDLLQ
jgi:outer membrane protein TolC